MLSGGFAPNLSENAAVAALRVRTPSTPPPNQFEETFLGTPIAAREPGWDFDDEAVGQFGSFGPDTIRAWTIASDHGYSLPNLPLKPRFSVKADISSGDDPRSQTLGTFYPVFPLGNYFGVLADTGPGPLNFIDVHPRIQTQLPHAVSVSTDLVVQWRENLHDGVYAVPGFLLVPAGTAATLRERSHAKHTHHRRLLLW